MRCNVVAVGTELLLGQIIDTNSSYIGEQLAAVGIASHLQLKVGDNLDRVVESFTIALKDADAIIVCGGLGPTHDDLTRDAIARMMGVDLLHDESVAAVIEEMFSRRGRRMSANNLRQAMVPVGARIIEQTRGTAPGLMCPVGNKMIYAVPGVPHEMQDMLSRAVLPDLLARSGEKAVISSRVLRTWGESESGLNDLKKWATPHWRSWPVAGKASKCDLLPRQIHNGKPMNCCRNGKPKCVHWLVMLYSVLTPRIWNLSCWVCCKNAVGHLVLLNRSQVDWLVDVSRVFLDHRQCFAAA
jgi:competence/damage-inducible protein CinA-like protein